MKTVTTEYSTANNAKVRRVKAKAALYDVSGSLLTTYTQSDKIKSIEIQRVGEDSKFFGFGIAHRVNIKLIDKDSELNISTANHFKISLGIQLTDGTVEYIDYPDVYVTEVNRDENTGELSITAYDILKDATTHTFGELSLTTPYTLLDVAEAAAFIIDGTERTEENPVFDDTSLSALSLSYSNGANFDGTETITDVFKAIAEATQTIYYINSDNLVHFKRLDVSGNAVQTISKDNYITLDSSNNRRLQTICSATELGDNVSASTTQIGTTQYVRDNPFWDLRDDIADLVNIALEAVGDMTINQFECSWRGNLALEPGDKITLVTKDNATVISYLLNDTITYNGGLTQKTEWNYTDSNETESNPTSLGNTLKQTYARVDKANKQIKLLASNVETNNSNISSLQVNTDSILAAVENIESSTSTALTALNNDIDTLTKKVEATVSAEDVSIAIKSELSNGVNKVTTSTGFTFNEEGLTVSKTGSEMTTIITEDGMIVYRDNDAMLTADNTGVNAVNLHATTYLIIGNNSRLEDWEKNGEARTACFWIGGNN